MVEKIEEMWGVDSEQWLKVNLYIFGNGITKWESTMQLNLE